MSRGKGLKRGKWKCRDPFRLPPFLFLNSRAVALARLCMDAGRCYHGNAGISLSGEARTKNNGGIEDCFALGLLQASKISSPKS